MTRYLALIFFSSVFTLGCSQEKPLPIYKSFDAFEKVLHQDNDTTYVINFWATWCKPCVAELPYFEELTKKYSDKKVKVVLVSLDFEKNIDSKLKPFLKKNKIESDVVLLLDPHEQEWIEKVDPSWSGAIPITIFYKNDKRLFLEQSFHSYDDIEKALLTVY